jgi:hypothetical protein
VERVDVRELGERLAAEAPPGFEVLAVGEVPINDTSLMAAAQGMTFELQFPQGSEAEVATAVQAVLSQQEILVERKGKTRSKKKGGRGAHGRRAPVMRHIDIRPMLSDVRVDRTTVQIDVVNVDGRPGKIREFLPMLTERPDQVQVLKRDTMVLQDGKHCSMAEAWGIQSLR